MPKLDNTEKAMDDYGVYVTNWQIDKVTKLRLTNPNSPTTVSSLEQQKMFNKLLTDISENQHFFL